MYNIYPAYVSIFTDDRSVFETAIIPRPVMFRTRHRYIYIYMYIHRWNNLLDEKMGKGEEAGQKRGEEEKKEEGILAK